MIVRTIWLDEAYEEFDDKPDNTIIGIEGRLQLNHIGVWVKMFGANDVEVEYWGKDIGSKIDPDTVNRDDIYESYSHKIVAVKKMIGKDYQKWLQDFQRRLREQEGKNIYYDHQDHQWYEVPSDQPLNP